MQKNLAHLLLKPSVTEPVKMMVVCLFFNLKFPRHLKTLLLHKSRGAVVLTGLSSSVSSSCRIPIWKLGIVGCLLSLLRQPQGTQQTKLN